MTKEYVLALGYFDCVHIGHRQIIKETLAIARSKADSYPAVLTFDDKFLQAVGRDEKMIYTLEERTIVLNSLGIFDLLVLSSSKNIIQREPVSFLEYLFYKYKISAVVCGSDYKFGKNRKGDVQLLQIFCKQHNVNFKIMETILHNDQKVSSSDIRKLLVEGAIPKANILLSLPYFISGKVVHGNEIGRLIGFPTANICTPKEKLLPAFGVYSGYVIIDKKRFLVAINIGEKPTFSIMHQAPTVEAHILSFSRDIYDCFLVIYIVKKIRDIIKFESVQELTQQLKTDMRSIRNG
jgi:riboflavin kinase/FMN adenylyltransferase